MSQWLNTFRDEETIYYLNKAGRERVGESEVITKAGNYKHTLMRNDIFIKYGMPQQWRNEYKIPLGDSHIIADTVFGHQNRMYILEVDHMQKMNANQFKYECYKKLKDGGVRFGNGIFPTIIWYTATESRRNQLKEINPGLDIVVYTKKDLL
jgi:hypothetical protein